MKFFFEGEESSIEKPEDSKEKEFFFLLQEAGVVQQPGDEPEAVSSDAKMKNVASRLLDIEYGTYKDTYAVHLTAIHPAKNLSTEQKVYEAMRELVLIMNEFVPQTLQVKLHPPRADWQVKVISAVIEGGATAWNFDIPKFELEAVPRIQAAIERVVMK